MKWNYLSMEQHRLLLNAYGNIENIAILDICEPSLASEETETEYHELLLRCNEIVSRFKLHRFVKANGRML